MVYNNSDNCNSLNCLIVRDLLVLFQIVATGGDRHWPSDLAGEVCKQMPPKTCSSFNTDRPESEFINILLMTFFNGRFIYIKYSIVYQVQAQILIKDLSPSA